jgi:putative (di)nucleoside polyphosphate hydrolase
VQPAPALSHWNRAGCREYFAAVSSTSFRASVGAVVLNDAGLVLAGERTSAPGSWQLPQGGLDEGEAPRDAVLREVEEETSIRRELLEVLAEHPEWIAYELPPALWARVRARGQVQKWFLLRFTGSAADIDIARATSDEFRALRWQRLAELAEAVPPFRRPVYRRLLEAFGSWLA